MNIPPNENGYYPADSKGVRRVSRVFIVSLIVFVIVGAVVLSSDIQKTGGNLTDTLAVASAGMMLFIFLYRITHAVFGKKITKKYMDAMYQPESQPIQHKKFLVGEDAYKKRMSRRHIEEETSKWENCIPLE